MTAQTVEKANRPAAAARMAGAAGFSLVEVTLALAMGLAVLAVVFLLVA